MRSIIRTALCGAITASFLVACGGGSSSSPTSPPTTTTPSAPVAKPYTNLETREEAARFLIQAGFGGTDSEIDALVGTDAADWIAAEIRKTPTLTLPLMQARYPTRQDTGNNHARMLWQTLLTADDQLRQRMMFALSQIFVMSTDGFFNQGYATAYYTDILSGQAFGNYRNILGDVTYSPVMANYLTYYRNEKGDARSGRMPDENYAREILQLFSIGLVELNMDGTPKAGEPETYNNSDITGLANVFTGLSGKGPSYNYDQQDIDWPHNPLQMYDEQHSPLEKNFLGVTIPENTDGITSIETALDTIFNHPNVAPFISRQLIQRFTSSSPDPAYVGRVARVFEAGRYSAPNGQEFGIGRRGDLQAVIAAILLDETVHDDVQTENEGKVREPVLKFIHYARAFETRDIDVWAEWRFGNTKSPSDSLGQHPFRSPSVFNFYRPGFISPASRSGAAGLTAPEFQIVNEGASLGFVNFTSHYIMRRADDPADFPGFTPDFAHEIELADDVEALVDHLDVKLTAGQLSEATKTDIIDVVSTLVVDGDDADVDRRKRAQTAVLMTIGSGAYMVQD